MKSTSTQARGKPKDIDGASAGKELAGRGPQTETERLVAGIWQRVLRVDEIDVGAEFAEFGGDSLMAIEVFLNIEQVFGKGGERLLSSAIFHCRTVEETAEAIDRHQKTVSKESKKLIDYPDTAANSGTIMAEQTDQLIKLVQRNPDILPALLKHAAKLTTRPTSSKLVSELSEAEQAARNARKSRNQAAWRARKAARLEP